MWIYLNNYSTAGGTGVTKETTYKVGTRDNKKIEIRIALVGGDWAAAFVYGNTDVPLQSWHHIAATYDSASGQTYVYLDGKEDGAGKFSGKISTTTNVMWIGRGAAPFFDGIYDEVSIWNTVLSKDEIIQASLSLSAVEFRGKLSATWGRMKL
ncbi:MAG: LamG domain-containing protein [Deltaproteobacteria bacterium]|nr:LamG domain-containing protein [Deltaproteobacteria bacterium]